jgi:hypothetical protein
MDTALIYLFAIAALALVIVIELYRKDAKFATLLDAHLGLSQAVVGALNQALGVSNSAAVVPAHVASGAVAAPAAAPVAAAAAASVTQAQTFAPGFGPTPGFVKTVMSPVDPGVPLAAPAAVATPAAPVLSASEQLVAGLQYVGRDKFTADGVTPLGNMNPGTYLRGGALVHLGFNQNTGAPALVAGEAPAE